MLTAIKQFFSKIPTIVYIGIVAFVSRIVFLTKSDVWHDEGYSAMIINRPLSDILAITANDVHPPLYYLLLNFWQSIFGPSVVSLRGFSVLVGVATVILLYFLLRKIFSEKIAVLGGIFAAIGPFLVRYSFEMRMYSLVALLAVASTYLLVLALDKKTKNKLLHWIGYGLTIATGLYTQYFFIFILPTHFIYTLQKSQWDIKTILKNKGWWLGYAIAGGLFLLWLPTMINQMSRVQEKFWIPAVDASSIPKTISMFMIYSDILVPIFGYTLLLAIILLPYYMAKNKRVEISLVAGWLIFPIIGVFLLSLSRSVYIDRYFTYSAPAFYALLAVIIGSLKLPQKKQWISPMLASFVFGLMLIGAFNISLVSTHQMGQAISVVNQKYQPGDKIISAELYTFFDSSYYNQTNQPIYLLSKKPFTKYGEYSLIYDQPHLRIPSLSSVKAERVWLIGKAGEKRYFRSGVPKNWNLIEAAYSGGDTIINLYQIKS